MDIIRKYALINALEYGGTASVKAIMGKVMGESPELREDPQQTLALITKEADRINGLSQKEQEAELRQLYPDYFKEKQVVREKELPPLPESDHVVTRIPPEPNGFPHIGHGLSFYFNYYYARRYDGKVILRFDDTNPEKEQLCYYDEMKKGIRWLQIDWDEEHYESDDLPLFYDYAEQLIEQTNAYVCLCPQSKIKKDRYEMKDCECRNRSDKENMALWKQMLEGTPHILRLKGDMKSPDSQMRDPTLFRVVKSPHPIQEDTYVVWPTYDFACAIEDAVLGITHVLRSNEFHTTLQNHIRALLGLRDPIIIQYSRFNVKGSPASKRKLRPLIKENLVKGWDDIRLTTLLALERRGIVPETIHALAVEMGLSTSEPIIDWSIIEALNRKIIDPTAHRYFFVPDPVKLTIENAPEMTVRLRLHPDHDYGFRTIKTTNTFYIPRDEVTDHFRLKDLYNVAIIDIIDRGDDYRGKYTGKKMKKEIDKIQWVTEKNVPVTVEIPHELFADGEFNPQSLEIVEGVAEEAVGDLSIGDIIQFERFGFCRIDALDGKVRACYAHR